MRNLGLGAIATAALIITITALACSLSAETATPAGASAPASTAPIWAAFITGAATTVGVVLTLGYNGWASRKAQQTTAATGRQRKYGMLNCSIITAVT